MNQRQLATTLFAAAGVFIAATAVPDVFVYASMVAQWEPSVVDSGGSLSGRGPLVASLVGALLALAIGVGLVAARNALADRLFRDGSEALAAPEALAVGVAVVGCYLAVTGVAQFMSRGGPAMTSNFGYLAQAVLGVVAFVGSRGIARLWSTIRGAGVNERDSSGRTPAV